MADAVVLPHAICRLLPDYCRRAGISGSFHTAALFGSIPKSATLHRGWTSVQLSLISSTRRVRPPDPQLRFRQWRSVKNGR